MSRRLLVLLPLLLAFPAARAAGDPPAHPAWWPQAEPFTKGAVQGFIKVYGDPKAITSAAKPTKPAKAGGRGDLHLVNERAAPAVVRLGSLSVGVLGPFREGVLHGVPAGDYTATFRVFNGYTWSVPVHTQVSTPTPK